MRIPHTTSAVITICLTVVYTSSYAQSSLWGISSGGDNHAGVIFKAKDNGENPNAEHTFSYTVQGAAPLGGLVLASNGKMYGTTTRTGSTYEGEGVLFEYDPISTIYTVRAHFDNNRGSEANGGLLQADNGKLYGTTLSGGTNGLGVLFEYDIASATYTKRMDMDSTHGEAPSGYLIQASNGKIYGTTEYGGAFDKGVLFEYNPVTLSYAVKIHFGGGSGENPLPPIQANNGKLYGLTRFGGANNSGRIYEYDPATNIHLSVVDIMAGYLPEGTFVQADNDMLYILLGDGLWEFNTSNYSFVFKYGGIGYHSDGLMKASNGKLYGVAESNGNDHPDGLLFEYDPVVDSWSTKVGFDPAVQGQYPSGRLIQAGNGKLYGMAKYGGKNQVGTLFEYAPLGSVFNTKINFGEAPQGSIPTANIHASNGKIYGLTWAGGSEGKGVLYEYDPMTHIYIKKVDFSQTIGTMPVCLLQSIGGKLYGTTISGGIHDHGVLFEYDIATGTYTKKVDFLDVTLGSYPNTLLQAGNGKLYGSCSGFGGNQSLFEYDPISGNCVKKVLLGDYCTALVLANNTKLYGILQTAGSYTSGVLFEYDVTTTDYQYKVEFTGGADGKFPISLIKSSNGKLYGATQLGGSNDQGTLFEYNPLSGTHTKKLDFGLNLGANINGYYPIGLLQSGSGKIYGSADINATIDPNCSEAQLFEYDLVTNTYTNKSNFNALGNCQYGVLTFEMCAATTVSQSGNTLTAVAGASSYQWLDCANGNAPINGATAQTFTPTMSGNYSVIVTLNGCTSISNCYFVSAVGVQSLPDADTGLSVYPNPATSSVQIAVKETGILQLYTATGQLVWSEQHLSPAVLTKDISHLPAGLYTVLLLNETGTKAKPLSIR